MGRRTPFATALALLCLLALNGAQACTRVVFKQPDGTVYTGRTMDWSEDPKTSLYVSPRGMSRYGMAGANSLNWTSTYATMSAPMYDLGTVDAMNERGLVGNLLYFSEASYGNGTAGGKPRLSIYMLLQYVADSFATVGEAVAALAKQEFNLVEADLPNGLRSAAHLALSDAAGDSAIVEVLNEGAAVNIYHNETYLVLTNSPPFNEQLALLNYWRNFNGDVLPGTSRASERFQRASYYINNVPKSNDAPYSLGQLRSILRNVNAPLGYKAGTADASGTQWFHVLDHTNLRFYHEAATDPAVTWVNMADVTVTEGAPVMRLDWWRGWNATSLQGRAGSVADLLTPLNQTGPLPPALGARADGKCSSISDCLVAWRATPEGAL